jgi:probable HAF family extracellular repeat protein
MSGVPSGNFHAFLWAKKHGMKDLGTLPGDQFSWANNISHNGTIVGTSFPPGSAPPRAFVWENGKMTDLNLIVGRHPRFYLAEAFAINDRGWIAGWGLLRNGDHRAYVLYPCGEGNTLKSNGEGC